MASLKQFIVPRFFVLLKRLDIVVYTHIERYCYSAAALGSDVVEADAFGEGEEGAAGHEDEGGCECGFAVARC